jgi:hypothetical protein
VKTPIIIIMMDTVEGREEFPATRDQAAGALAPLMISAEQTAPLYFGNHEIIYLVDASSENSAAQTSLAELFALACPGESDVGGWFFLITQIWRAHESGSCVAPYQLGVATKPLHFQPKLF